MSRLGQDCPVCLQEDCRCDCATCAAARAARRLVTPAKDETPLGTRRRAFAAAMVAGYEAGLPSIQQPGIPASPAGTVSTAVYFVTTPPWARAVRKAAERIARWTERFDVHTRQGVPAASGQRTRRIRL